MLIIVKLIESDIGIIQNQILWDKCIAFSIDNVAVNMGLRNSIKGSVLVKNPAVYFVGCPCHMANNAARKGEDSFSGAFGFDVDKCTN